MKGEGMGAREYYRGEAKRLAVKAQRLAREGEEVEALSVLLDAFGCERKVLRLALGDVERRMLVLQGRMDHAKESEN